MAKLGKGPYEGGTIFKITSAGTGFTVIRSFNPNTDGYHPDGSLLEGSDNCLYDATSIVG